MTKAQAWKSYGALPMSFEVNQGQADPSVRFVARGRGYSILLSPVEATLALESSQPDRRFPEKTQPKPSTRVLSMKIEGANPSAAASALDRLPGVSNYFIGNDPSRWHTNIPTYKKVQFDQIRPGVDLVYYGNQRQLEYDFVLSPGVAPQSLGLSFEGSTAAIGSHGDLVFSSTDGQMTFHRPVAYQTDKSDPAKKHYLPASYVLRGHNRVGFKVAHYDHRQPLIIDPSLSYSTYLGGSGGDTGNAIALDSIFDAYITGSTSSTNFPKGGSPPPYQGSYGGDTDAFITKLRYDGEAIIYSTYLGGNNYDIGQGIGVDTSNDVYVTGSTSSANFPTTASAFQTTYGGNSDAFVSKLDPSGSKLLFSSYLGGSDIDYGLALALDPSGNVFVTGSTQSSDFPTVDPVQSGNAGNGDAFVAEIDTNLGQTQQLVYSTYLGGSSADSGQGIAVDSGDNAYVTGFTFSTNFPVYNAYQSANAGSVDAFISVISPGGRTLEFSTYLGGSGDDRAWAIALDSVNNIYIAGSSYTACTPATTITTLCNPNSTFPTTPGAYQTFTTKQAPGYPVAFVTEMNHFGTALLYSTLVGGSYSDAASGIAVDSSGDAYVTGYTESSDFPTANAVQASYIGGSCGASPCQDAFVTEFNPQGTSLVYSTFLAGTNGNFGNAITVDTNGNAYIAGSTFSQSFPAIALAYQGESGNTTGLSSVFISQISHNSVPAVSLTPQKIAFGNVTENTTVTVTSENVPATVTVLNASTAPLQISGVATTGDFAETNNCVGTLPAGGGVCTINVTYTPTVLSPETELLSITDNAAGSPHLVTLTGTGITGLAQVQFSPSSLVFPATTLNTTSAAQNVTMTNNGETPLTVTNIAASGDFAETNTCPAYPFTMAVGGSCNFSITFTPTNTGVRKGSLTVTDNVTSGSSSFALTGTGNPNFQLTSPTTTQFLPIGTAATTFTINMSAPPSLNFTDTVALSCSPGTCSFNPSNIALSSTTVPSSSILTLGGLSPTSANPFIFAVNGADVTSGNETATLSLSVYFGDFSISATPAVNTIQSGATTIYSVTVSPVNNFNQAVTLSCLKSTVPQGALCLANPASLTPQIGAAVSSQLSISTTAQSTTTTGHLLPRATPPRTPPPTPMMFALWGACNLVLIVVFLIRGKLRRRAPGSRRRIIFAQLALAMLALAAVFWVSCDTQIYTNVIQPSTINGTPTGNYKVTILGTYTGSTAGIGITTGTQTTVIRETTVNLVVQ
ncbi:MAG: SBBP repeat-containing protein [Terriglobia bacterium]